MNMKKKNKKGFTLIELIVVIAILAIIAALAIPSFNGLKESSAQQIADSNARSAYTAAMAAQAINDNGTFDKTAVINMLADSDFTSTNTNVIVKSATDKTIVGTTWEGTIGGYKVTGTYPKGATGTNLG